MQDTAFVVPLAIICTCAGAQPVLLNSFEGQGALDTLQPHSSGISLSTEHATHGDTCLRVDFEVAAWPNVWLLAGESYDVVDWREYGVLLADVYNPQEEALKLNLRIDSSQGADGNVDSRQGGIGVPPRRALTLAYSIPQHEMFMRGGPAAAGGDISGTLSQGQVDLSNIIAFQFFLAHPAREYTVFIDNIRLAEAGGYEGIVDRFGQYTGDDWPGKVHEEAQLRMRRRTELRNLRNAPRPDAWDKWGGWADGARLKATGWFRTEKHNGRWWLVTPDGTLFWSTGLDCIGPSQRGPIKDREHLFTYLPEPDDPLHKFGGADTKWIDFYAMNLHRKYGSEYFDPWLDMTRMRMAAWGFNTAANWCNWDCYRQLDVPYTAPLHTGGSPTFQAAWREMVDVYDDEWPQVAEKHITGGTKAFGNDPHCIGYFVDNELPWGHRSGMSQYGLVTNALQLPPDRAVKRRFVELLHDRYDTIARFNETWGTDFGSWEQCQDDPVEPANVDSQAVREDLSMLLRDFAQRYFSTVDRILQQHAPNQLYLGARFSVAPIDVIEVAAKYCDVLSFNIYGKAANIPRYAAQFEHIDMPWIIGEFHFGALDRGMFHGGLVPVADQAERGEQYARYVKTALDMPGCVGAHWFQYIDEALTGRFDGENYNIGFVSVADTPYGELVGRAKAINRRVYELRDQ